MIPHSAADECVETPLVGGALPSEPFVVVGDSRGEATPGGAVAAAVAAAAEGTAPAGASAPGAWELPRPPPPEQVSRVEHVIQLASGQTEQDHPVCGDCLKALVAEVQRLVDAAQADQRAYTEAHALLQEQLGTFSDEETAQLEAEIEAMEAEEQQLVQQLEACDAEERELQQALDAQGRQEEALQREEDELWLAFAEYQLDLEAEEEERAATASAIRYATSELNRLQRTHVLNDMFHISDQGPFGTINKFRMGRLPDVQVPWEEVNAAWGQACLLLDALIKRCGISTGQYRLRPRGSFSAIQVGEEVFNLYNRDSGLMVSFWTQRNYDQAMVSFLSCLESVIKWLQRDQPAKPPYKIDGEKVGGYSIRSLFSQPDRWTRALKAMLSDLKWAIVYVENKTRDSHC